MANDIFKIKCKYCGNPYSSMNKNREHCRRTSCRSKEIQAQIDNLGLFIEIFCSNNIESTIEIRLPGNDKLSPEAKVESESIIDAGFEETNNCKKEGVKLDRLLSYFEPILWKSIKGNFIIKTLRDGTVDRKILSQTFAKIENPVIIGNNLIVTGISK